MIYYAIKHVPSGQYIGLPSGRGGRGGTHARLVSPEGPYPPRLFHTAHAAKIALTYWLGGPITVTHYRDDWTGEYDEDWHIEPAPERKREDMEIVALKFTEVPL